MTDIQLTIEGLSLAVRHKSNILRFIDDDMLITVLPPFPIKKGYIFQNSVFINNIDQDVIGDIDEELAEKWWHRDSLFRESFKKLIFYDVITPKMRDIDANALRHHLVSIENKEDYINKFNIMFNDGNADCSFSIDELTESRAKRFITMSKSNLTLEFKDVKIVKPSKKILLNI